jgi:prepilin-type N-terminal cleavage/methylation domain-containing protein
MRARVQAVGGRRAGPSRPGFTLPEILVVVLIVGIVTVLTIGVIYPTFSHRQVSEAGRILQGSLVGARDDAIHLNRASGIRLLPDPAFPINYINGQVNPYAILAFNRIVPIQAAPDYSEGMVSVFPGKTYPAAVTNAAGVGPALPTLILEAAPVAPNGSPNPPTSWMWNIRVGDRVQLNGAGAWYTVIGPLVVPAGGATVIDCATNKPIFVGNSEMFVNTGAPGCPSAYQPGGVPTEYLVLVDGVDDNRNGWIDEGWDGVDNNGDGQVDEPAEWVETEAWQGAAARGLASVPYVVKRRPMPSAAAREVALPSHMVIDATTVMMTRERSRLPVNPYTGYVDVVINPDGTVVPQTIYSTPASVGMDGAFYHFWLADRADLADVALTPPPPGSPPGTPPGPPPVPIEAGQLLHYLPIAKPAGADASYALPTLKGGYALLTLFSRSGQITVTETPAFDDPIAAAAAGRAYNSNLPFLAPMQGAR